MATPTKTLSEVVDGLSGTLWPIHLKPKPDELLSSWIIRLAHGHGYKVETLCTLLFGYRSAIWNRDIDKLAPIEVGEALIQATGATWQQFEETTLRSFEGYLFERHNVNGPSRWLIPLSLYHRSRKRPGLMFCAACLASDEEPYFRRIWRTAFATICTAHGNALRDTCPKCSAPVAPHRADMMGKNLYPHGPLNTRCWSCDYDLRNIRSLQAAPLAMVNFQRRFEDALKNGHIDWAGNPGMHSIPFFNGMRLLIGGLHSALKVADLSAICELDSRWKLSRLGIESASLEHRAAIFTCLEQITRDWPSQFLQLLKISKKPFSTWCHEPSGDAFWYEALVRRECYSGRARLSLTEVDAISDWHLSQGRKLVGKKAREIAGRDITKFTRIARYGIVSNDSYEELMISLDHEIACTQSTNERSLLLRDKVMFATARVFSLDLGDLAALKIGDFDLTAVNDLPPEFNYPPITWDESKAWISWYVTTIRPSVRVNVNEQALFVSPRTGRGLGPTSVSGRFCRAVGAAGLERTIKSYTCWTRPSLTPVGNLTM